MFVKVSGAETILCHLLIQSVVAHLGKGSVMIICAGVIQYEVVHQFYNPFLK